jgi:diguanylate cyclase (GGDEF)-like protein
MPFSRPSTASHSWQPLRQSTVQTRIVLLITAMLLIAAVAGTAWNYQNHAHAHRLRENYQREKQEFVRQIVDLKATRLQSYVIENTYWDEAVVFLTTRNQEWAKVSLNLPAQNVEAAGLWVFRRDGSAVHTWLAPRQQPPWPDTEMLRAYLPALASRRMMHWFARVNGEIWEMHGATIHPSNDPQHRGEFYGYLIAGRPLNQAYLYEIGKITHCRLWKPHPLPQGTQETKNTFLPTLTAHQEMEWVTLSLPLLDADGNTIGYLNGVAENSLAPAIEQATHQAIALFAVFSLVLFSLTLFVLIRWLSAPIGLLLHALQNHDSARLAPLLSEQTEFGVLARFIAAFFRQERALRESHEELETRVANRTAELAHIAYHDALTQLPNRALFSQRLNNALARHRNTETVLAVLFVDLDDFKVVNDSLGHEAGDGLLCSAAQRMQQCLPAHAVIARLGGDEFAILLENTSDTATCFVAEHIAKVLQNPFSVAGHTLNTSASIGVALGRKGESSSDLLRNADIAMYHAKGNGRSQNHSAYTLFREEMLYQANERLEMEASLRHALYESDTEFRLVFQPIYNLQTRELSGLEALLRWEHPVNGMISPSKFIPLAEETGLIHDLTKWVLCEVGRCEEMLLAQLPTSANPVFISVNFSALCLKTEGIASQILHCLQQNNVSPARFAVEVTESAIAQQSQTLLNTLKELRAAGVRVLMDDFGTGYSSLASLMHLPVDILKVDQAFIGSLEERPETRNILRAIVTLANSLQMEVICEGIERDAQFDIVAQMGSLYGQGFLFGQPLSHAEFAETFPYHLPETIGSDLRAVLLPPLLKVI